MNDQRPAETVTPLANYFWWLLPQFLKRKERQDSLIGRWVETWGETFQDLRDVLAGIVPELVVATATGSFLDQLARARQIFRGEGESDESLRIRVLAAHQVKRKGGTIPGMVSGLAAIGYGVQVEEPNNGTSRWSRFVVRVLHWDGVVANQMVFYSIVRLLKPAHTKALVDPALGLETWDDWILVDPPEELDDGGLLDSWPVTIE